MTRATLHTTARFPLHTLAEAALVVAFLLLVHPALAHVGPVRGTTPFVVDDTFRGGATTWGIVLAEGDRFLRVCEEAVGETPAFHEIFDDGRILIGGQSGLFVTTDGGCTYASVPFVWSGLPFVSLARARANPSVVIVATTTTLYRSSDAGVTFAAQAPIAGAPILREVVVDDDGVVVAATGFSGTGQPFLARSDDGGATFSTTVRPDLSRLIALTVDTDGAVLASEIPPLGGSTLASIAADLTSTALATFDGAVTDAVVYADARHVIVDKQSMWSETAPLVFTELFAGPSGCFARPPGASALWGCARFADLTHFLSTTDAVSFTGHMSYGLVEERVCPVGSPGQVRCSFADGGVIDAGVVDGGRADAGALDAGTGEPPPAWCACEGTGPAQQNDAVLFCSAACALVLFTRRRRGARQADVSDRRTRI
jgi:hypothetical protein